jgi:hypothetical protein
MVEVGVGENGKTLGKDRGFGGGKGMASDIDNPIPPGLSQWLGINLNHTYPLILCRPN